MSRTLSRLSGSGRETSVICRSGREVLPVLRQWSGGPFGFLEWSGVPPVCLAVVGSPSRMSGSGRETLPDAREWSGGPHRCPGVFGSPTRMSVKLSRIPRVIRGQSQCPGVVGRPYRKFGSSWKALSDVQ